MSPLGGTGTNLTPLSRAEESVPTWSPDGSRIGFLRLLGNEASVWVMDANGSHVERITRPPNGRSDVAVAWSPDGSKIAFLRYNSDDDSAFLMVRDMVTKEVIELHELLNANPLPKFDWSPGSQQIVLSHAFLYVVNADGTGLRQLTSHDLYDDAPDWSPDGEKIVFSRSEAGETRKLYLIDPDGTDETRISSTGESFNPRWSPDGTMIGYWHCCPGAHDLYVMEADGSNVRNVTDTAAVENNTEWTWSPNSKALVWSQPKSEKDRSQWIFTVEIEGGATGLVAPARDPDWLYAYEPSWQVCDRDCVGPTARLDRPERWKTYRDLGAVRGRAEDYGDGLHLVRVAIMRQDGRKCLWWNGKRFVAGRCSQRLWHRASGRRNWSYAFKGSLDVKGVVGNLEYQVFAQAKDSGAT